MEAGLPQERLDEVRERAAGSVRRRSIERGMAVARQEFDVPTREFPDGVAIGCENRVALCRAACCRLTVGLSGEDVREGISGWDVEHPLAGRARPARCPVRS